MAEPGAAADGGRDAGFPGLSLSAAAAAELLRYPHGRSKISIDFSESRHSTILGTLVGGTLTRNLRASVGRTEASNGDWFRGFGGFDRSGLEVWRNGFGVTDLRSQANCRSRSRASNCCDSTACKVRRRSHNGGRYERVPNRVHVRRRCLRSCQWSLSARERN